MGPDVVGYGNVTRCVLLKYFFFEIFGSLTSELSTKYGIAS